MVNAQQNISATEVCTDKPQHWNHSQEKWMTLSRHRLVTMCCWETLGPSIYMDATWHAPSTQTLFQPVIAVALNSSGTVQGMWQGVDLPPKFPRSQSDWPSYPPCIGLGLLRHGHRFPGVCPGVSGPRALMLDPLHPVGCMDWTCFCTSHECLIELGSA